MATDKARLSHLAELGERLIAEQEDEDGWDEAAGYEDGHPDIPHTIWLENNLAPGVFFPFPAMDAYHAIRYWRHWRERHDAMSRFADSDTVRQAHLDAVGEIVARLARLEALDEDAEVPAGDKPWWF